jgi:hypothetical protein
MFSSSIYSQSNKVISNVDNANYAKIGNIDAGDSVVFDLSQINLASSPLEVPVSIISDDTIYALDFSLKYDHNALEYDTIMDITSYLVSLSYYNTNDSTIRYTSYSLQPCDTVLPLVLVRFNLLTATFSNANLYSLKAYLNGNQCSIKVILPTISSVSEAMADQFNIYPNPASQSTTVECAEPFELEVYNQLGERENTKFDYLRNNSLRLDLNTLKSGMYLLKMKSAKGLSIKKLFVCH